jgi:hypothetical protein
MARNRHILHMPMECMNNYSIWLNREVLKLPPSCYFWHTFTYSVSDDNKTVTSFSSTHSAIKINQRHKWHWMFSFTLMLVPYFPALETHFFPRKMWPKFNLCLMRRGYYFQTYKYPYVFIVR